MKILIDREAALSLVFKNDMKNYLATLKQLQSILTYTPAADFFSVSALPKHTEIIKNGMRFSGIIDWRRKTFTVKFFSKKTPATQQLNFPTISKIVKDIQHDKELL